MVAASPPVPARPEARAELAGGYWLVLAGLSVTTAAVFAVGLWAQSWWERCYGPFGGPGQVPPGRCDAQVLMAFGSYVGFWLLGIGGVVAGLAIGVVQGRRRRPFASGRRIAVAVVGITAAWTLVAFAVAYGLGRALPPSVTRPSRPRRPAPAQLAAEQGWHGAVSLYRALSAGFEPPVMSAVGFLGDEPVYLDTILGYRRFYGVVARYQANGMIAVGSPAVVVGATIGNLVGAGVGRAAARRRARPQWREQRAVRVVVTASTSWCLVDGRWLRFDHAAVMDYQVIGQAVMLTFAGADPLLLEGPAVWCHAVLFAYLRGGAVRLQDAHFLHPIRTAAIMPAFVPPPRTAAAQADASPGTRPADPMQDHGRNRAESERVEQ